MSTVLVVDDERPVRESIRMILEYEKFDVHFAENGPAAFERLAAQSFDLIFLDIKMPGMDGLRVLERLREEFPRIPVVMISGHGTIETAVEATRLGAFDFLSKPLDRAKLIITARNATEVKQLRERVEGKDAILGESKGIRDVLAVIERVAPTESRVLITGENGTGKELVAKAIHRLSKRRTRALVELNCAAIPNDLIESELFGHEKGAFTGAAGIRVGRFELADGGTLFLDEIGDMSTTAQAKVLRALEENAIERVGGNRPIPINVRVIAATNKNLSDAIAQSRFREDLYHRLNVIPIRVPALRERREDIPVLVTAFADEVCRVNGMPRRSFTDDALRRLQAMAWSGNVRELRNTVERLVIMTPGTVIDAAHVEPSPGPQGAGPLDELLMMGGTFQEFKDRAEAAFIKLQLEANGWNVSRTADTLQIQRSHLYNKMKKFGLAREAESEKG